MNNAPFKQIGLFTLIITGILFFTCRFFMETNDTPPLPNVLDKKDSLAVRGILDANGLDTVKVRDVIVLEHSNIVNLDLRSLSLNNFIFCSFFDSLLSRPPLDLMNNEIDTLIFKDTIKSDLAISLENNKIKTIPYEIGKLTGTIALYLNYNQINYISPNIMSCNVSFINIKYNRLCSVPDSLAKWISRVGLDSTWQSTQTCP